ncbi:MAG: DUF4410 domain-containing protein [Candidatus Sumerlaeaceae bacterium]|nr:DUF4410 domain-containing protein [Candidatus Sumerlaeaceae bacterium]
MIRRTAMLLLAGALVWAAAPGYSAKAFKTGWLQDYHRLGHVGGVPLEQIWIDGEFDIRNYRVLYVPPVQIDPCAYRKGGECDRAAAQRLATELRSNLVRQLQAAGIFEFVSTDPYFMNSGRQALTLQLRITELFTGNPKARSYIGLGAGATQVQLEGKLYDQHSTRTWMEFADRRLHTGSTLLIGKSATEDGEYLIGIDLKQMMDGIFKAFVYMREEGPVNNQP